MAGLKDWWETNERFREWQLAVRYAREFPANYGLQYIAARRLMFYEMADAIKHANGGPDGYQLY